VSAIDSPITKYTTSGLHISVSSDVEGSVSTVIAPIGQGSSELDNADETQLKDVAIHQANERLSEEAGEPAHVDYSEAGSNGNGGPAIELKGNISSQQNGAVII